MDLKQRKLNKSEWDSTEIPVSETELSILNMIINGYHDVSIKINKNNTLFTYIKIQYSEKMEDYLFNKYLRERLNPIDNKLKEINHEHKLIKININIKPNSTDSLRLEKVDIQSLTKYNTYEYLLLDYMENLMKSLNTTNEYNKQFHYYYYGLYKLIRNNVLNLNRHMKKFVYDVLNIFEEHIDK